MEGVLGPVAWSAWTEGQQNKKYTVDHCNQNFISGNPGNIPQYIKLNFFPKEVKFLVLV